LATVNSIALDLLREFDFSTDDSGLVSQVERWVNDALDEIAVATDWNHFHTRGTIPTVIAQAQYTLPAGAREIIQLRYIATGEPIEHWTVQEAARRGVILETAGRARAWLEDGILLSGSNNLYRIRLYPVPDAVVSIEAEYYYHPSDVASGSVLPVQDQHIVLVKDRVRAYILEEGEDQRYEAADRAQRRFESNLAKLVKREKHKVAANLVLKPSDIRRTRRPEAMFDASHYSNP
jgi:hypothetical protein